MWKHLLGKTPKRIDFCCPHEVVSALQLLLANCLAFLPHNFRSTVPSLRNFALNNKQVFYS